MEKNEPLRQPFINIGEINQTRVSLDVGELYRQFETDLRLDYAARPVPESHIYKEIRSLISFEMRRFPFFETTTKPIANLMTLDYEQKRFVNVDDTRLLEQDGIDFRNSAAFAIWAIDRELNRHGFEYDKKLHELDEWSLPVWIEQQIDTSFPKDLQTQVQQNKPSLRLITAKDAGTLVEIARNESSEAYERHSRVWDLMIKEHRRLFMQDPYGEDDAARLGIGFGIAAMEGLGSRVEDAERIANSFVAEIEQLDEERFKQIFGGR